MRIVLGLITSSIGGFLFAADVGSPVSPSAEQRAEAAALLKKHDLNENGKIDADERKAFNRERALKHLERTKAELARVKQNPRPAREQRPLYWWERELLPRYDQNKDGHLDEAERAAMPKDVLKAAQEERRQKLREAREAESASQSSSPAQ